MTYTALTKICMRCFPDLFVSEGEIFISLTGTGPVKHQLDETMCWRAQVWMHDWRYEWTCMFPGYLRNDCLHSYTIPCWLCFSHDSGCGRTQWWVAGPRLCMSVLSLPIIMNVHVPILLRLQEQRLCFFHGDILNMKWTGCTTETCFKSGWSPALVIAICIYVSLSYNFATMKQHLCCYLCLWRPAWQTKASLVDIPTIAYSYLFY